MSGTTDEPITLVPYDSAWPVKYERERELLERAIGPWAVGGIHHIGSTAVPGLLAKPIVDILVGVASLESSRDCFGSLKQLGYLYAPYKSTEMHWFCKPHPRRREYHLHLIPSEFSRFQDELSFRERLRASPGIAGEYTELKQSLAARFADNREIYTEAKSKFIARVLASNANFPIDLTTADDVDRRSG